VLLLSSVGEKKMTGTNYQEKNREKSIISYDELKDYKLMPKEKGELEIIINENKYYNDAN